MATFSLLVEKVRAAGGDVIRTPTTTGSVALIKAPNGRVWVCNGSASWALFVDKRQGRDLAEMYLRQIERVEMGTRPLLPSEKRA